MAVEGKPRLATGLRGLLSTGLGVVHTRVELFAVEVQEEKHRISAYLFNVVLAALFIGFGLTSLVIFITVALWDSHRLVALGVGTAVLLGAGLLTGATAARLKREGSHLFAASLAELARDRDALERRQ